MSNSGKQPKTHGVCMRILNIAKEFSKFPAGRFRSDGPNSAERFRDDLLIPVIDGELCIQLDGVLGYGSSFLEEAFGGLARKGYPVDKLMFDSVDARLISEIRSYMK